MLGEGTTVGAYQVERLLGSGGMGAVYAVRHLRMGTQHAMKVLSDAYLRNPDVRERFKREAQLMFSLGAHPNIVRATDVIDQQGTLALVLDLVDGGDLADALAARPGPMRWAEAWRILEPAVAAVTYAHKRQVVHRDLKPENVLLRRDGTWPGVPVVTDFGIAKVLGADSATRVQSAMGTACYGAPEQFRNARDVTAEADVWALGMMVWRLVNGRLPVDPEDNVALIRLYEGQVPVPRLTGVPGTVAEAVAAALNVDPKQRPRDASVLLRLFSAEPPDAVGADLPQAPLRPAAAQTAPRAYAPTSDLPSRVHIDDGGGLHASLLPDAPEAAPRPVPRDFTNLVEPEAGGHGIIPVDSPNARFWSWFTMGVVFGLTWLMHHKRMLQYLFPFAIGGVLMCVLLLVREARYRRRRDTWRVGDPVRGAVTDVAPITIGSEEGAKHGSRITYAFELTPGHVVQGTCDTLTAPDRFLTVGTPLWILVHPGDPARSVPYLAG
jgi:serine/threonine protein kinase